MEQTWRHANNRKDQLYEKDATVKVCRCYEHASKRNIKFKKYFTFRIDVNVWFNSLFDVDVETDYFT